MSGIFVFTAGNAAAREHLEDSIRKPISPDKVLPYFEGSLLDELRKQSQNEGLFAWGAIPGEQNRPHWNQMQIGDWVLGVYEKAYHYIARVTAKAESPECAEAIWGLDPDGDRFQLMYFLTRPQELDIPLSEVAPDLPSLYQGFFKPSPDSLAALANKYGSIDAFIKERFLNAGAKIKFVLGGKEYWFSPQDVRDAFAATQPGDWQSRPGRDPAFLLLVDNETKPVKAVFRHLPGISAETVFTTHEATRVLRRLQFEVAIADSPLCLLGTAGGGDPEMVQYLALLGDGKAHAEWWSFAIKPMARELLEKPFWLYINIGDNRIKYRTRVIDYRTTDETGGMQSPWPESTKAAERGVTRVGDSWQEVCRTWFLVDKAEILSPVLQMKDFVPAPALSKTTSLLNQNAFGYGYLRKATYAVDLPDTVKVPPDVATLFMKPEELASIKEALIDDKNVVLQGPPGVGKTHLADILPYLIDGVTDETVEWVQFHQSYAYEDFIQGYRPNDGGQFIRRNGVFFRFCERARAVEGVPHVFVIDEINRGNLSRIFGEVMMLIEPSKRSKSWAVNLTYCREDEEPFFVPANVHIIGLMNTADRSLALVDYALRRRFAFFDLRPQFGSMAFRDFLEKSGVEPEVINLVVGRITKLNSEIAADQDLGEGFQIGHSYFCPRKPGVYGRGWYEQIVDQKIEPLLREYWFDKTREYREGKVKELKA